MNTETDNTALTRYPRMAWITLAAVSFFNISWRQGARIQCRYGLSGLAYLFW